MLRPAVLAERPRELVDEEDDHGEGVDDQEHHLVEQRVREETDLRAVEGADRRAVGARTGVATAHGEIALALEQRKGILPHDLLRSSNDGQEVLEQEPNKGMPVPNALIVQADLDKKHGQDTVLRNMIRHSRIHDNLAPKGALLGVDDDGEDGGDLHGEDEPGLGLLELDEGGGHGDAGAGHGRGVGPDHGLDAGEGEGLPLLLLGEADPDGEGLDAEVEEDGEADLEDVRDENLGRRVLVSVFLATGQIFAR